MNRKPAISVGLVLAVIGCATAPAIPPTQTDRVVVTTETQILRGSEGAVMSVVVKAPPAKVLVALLSAYADLGIEVRLYDPSAGQVGNRDFSSVHRFAGERISKYLSCGQILMGLAADSYRITMSLVSQVTPHGSDTNLGTWLTASARDLATSSSSSSCVSTGALETKLNELVLQHIAG
jgi:hypothetical protein